MATMLFNVSSINGIIILQYYRRFCFHRNLIMLVIICFGFISYWINSFENMRSCSCYSIYPPSINAICQLEDTGLWILPVLRHHFGLLKTGKCYFPSFKSTFSVNCCGRWNSESAFSSYPWAFILKISSSMWCFTDCSRIHLTCEHRILSLFCPISHIFPHEMVEPVYWRLGPVAHQHSLLFHRIVWSPNTALFFRLSVWDRAWTGTKNLIFHISSALEKELKCRYSTASTLSYLLDLLRNCCYLPYGITKVAYIRSL